MPSVTVDVTGEADELAAADDDDAVVESLLGDAAFLLLVHPVATSAAATINATSSGPRGHDRGLVRRLPALNVMNRIAPARTGRGIRGTKYLDRGLESKQYLRQPGSVLQDMEEAVRTLDGSCKKRSAKGHHGGAGAGAADRTRATTESRLGL